MIVCIDALNAVTHSYLATPTSSVALMDLAFPCAGNLDDGVFDLGLEDDDEAGNFHRRRNQDEAPKFESSNPMKPQPEAEVSSPDALDLALMAFTAASEENGGSGAQQSSVISPRSPFCGAPIRQHDDAARGSYTQSRPEMGPVKPAMSPPRVQQGFIPLPKRSFDRTFSFGGRSNVGASSNSSRDENSAPLAKTKRGGYSATVSYGDFFSPGLRSGDSEGFSPVHLPSSGMLLPSDRRSEVSKPIPRHLQDRSRGDANATQRRDGERGSCDPILLGPPNDEEALAEIDRAAAAYVYTRATQKGMDCITGAEDSKRGSFAVDVARGAGMSSSGAGDVEEEEWEEELDAGTVHDQGKDDDLLARASELHLSVAGQLRSVNELLKRKSYFYIDTSWSARQLPCPPTAWKGSCVGTKTGDGGGVGIDTNSGGDASTSNTVRPRPNVSSCVNIVTKIEGRWLVSGSKKPRVGIFSIPGEKAHDVAWKCQDAGIAFAPLDRRESQSLFAVFDGHGANGREASRECMERLPKYLISASRLGDPASALRRTCQRLHRDLAMGVAGDCARSGTTLCAAVLTGRRLTVANVGDSGCLRISRVVDEICRLGDPTATGSGVVESEASAGGRRRRETGEVETEHRGSDRRVVVERLSRDHKPECSDELKRIQAAGGVVFPLQSAAVRGGRGVSGVPTAVQGGRQEGAETVRDFGAEVSRVWRPGGSGPGLAMSRSLGDKIAHSVGVTYEPEITEVDLDPRTDVMLVLASDGVWDVMSEQDIRKIAESHRVADDDTWCPRALSEEICRKSLSEWAIATRGGSDDITCLVVKTSGTPPTRRTSPLASKQGEAQAMGRRSKKGAAGSSRWASAPEEVSNAKRCELQREGQADAAE